MSEWRDAGGTFLLTIVFVCGTISFENPGFWERMTQVASTRLFMLKAEYPYIPPRSEIEEEADFLHASSEDVLARLLS